MASFLSSLEQSLLKQKKKHLCKGEEEKVINNQSWIDNNNNLSSEVKILISGWKRDGIWPSSGNNNNNSNNNTNV
ncbi:11333_t:CDS:2 [Diversispora eburnea]|uniref:11333_t:CDS:1 n=1 Tax=Diversispora eburnea TaxID=1213867 RepID=A0A9N9BWT9_9GLOM|nr:11333_t:CDS:2 [Diversispora eburnea]